tara:strand:- start:1 stop:516 length:516 start_codon:yes stop_codon:yes gene_type:complete
MPLLVLHYKNHNPGSSDDHASYASQRLKMSAPSVPIQKLQLVGFSANLSKHDTLAGGASHKIPDHIVVEIDNLQSSQINIASPPKTHNGEDHLQTHGIPIPLSDNLNTINFGMTPLEFDVNRKLERIINISIKYYDDNNNLVPMTTRTTNQGQVSLDHLLLYFQYNFAGLF